MTFFRPSVWSMDDVADELSGRLRLEDPAVLSRLNVDNVPNAVVERCWAAIQDNRYVEELLQEWSESVYGYEERARSRGSFGDEEEDENMAMGSCSPLVSSPAYNVFDV